jgi:hypothetical protein
MKKLIFSVLMVIFGGYTGWAQYKSYNINDTTDSNYQKTFNSNGKYTPVFQNAIQHRELILNPIFQNTDLIKVNDTIQLDLFNNIKYKASIEKIDVDVNNTLTIRARLFDCNYSYCFISTSNGKSLVIIDVPDHNELFKASYDHQSNRYYLQQIDKSKLEKLEGSPSRFPPVDDLKNHNSKKKIPPESQNPKPNSDAGQNIQNSLNDPVIVNDAPPQDTITLLIVYTPAAATWSSSNETNITNTISLLMAKAQLALDNSNTYLTLQLVWSEQVSYAELNNATDLDNLTYADDGYMDNVHSLRDTYLADVVVLLEYISFTGGFGWTLNTTAGLPDYAFSLTRVQQASSTFATIHEIGHNLGCGHHKLQNVYPGPDLFSYSAGWRWRGTNLLYYCSVMTYESGIYFDDGITHTQVGYFSNPNVTHQGVATGDATDGDNARTIREMKSVIAGYRAISTVPKNESITNVTFNPGTEECFNATDTIIVAGDGNPVTITINAVVTLISGGSIFLKNGLIAHGGSYLNAYITETGSFCESLLSSIVYAEDNEKSISLEPSSPKSDNLSNTKWFKVYPNPNNGRSTLELINFEGLSTISIFNTLGSVVYHTTVMNNDHYELELETLRKGLYFITVKNGETIKTSKIIIQ